MGGASSRMDQTQWWNADGELMVIDDQSEKKHATILPGAEPTSTLEIFDILKSKSLTATRDFEVKDGNKKVIYATRGVPGTMAWFDVIKPGGPDTPELVEGNEEAEEDEEEEEAATSEAKEVNEDKEETLATASPGNERSQEELLLRAQADWNRRSWTIHTLTPVFPGQLPATLTSRKGLEEGCELYKSCCITLSWSKSLAVVARYGPPTKVQDYLEDDEEEEKQKQTGATEPRDEENGESEHSLEEDDIFAKAESIAAKGRKNHNVDEDVVKHNQSQTLHQSHASLSSAAARAEDEPAGVMDTFAKSIKTYIDPALEQPRIQLTPEEKQRYALEGVVNLDAPLLLCQTVLGQKKNFQTRLIDKQETAKLWVLDDAWNKERFLKQEDEDTTQGSTKSPLGKAVAYELSQLERPHDVEELKEWFSTQYVDEDQRYMVKDDIKKVDVQSSLNGKRASLLEVGKSWFSFRAQHKSDGDESVATQEEPSENTEAGDSAKEETATEETKTETTVAEAGNAKVYGSNHGVLELDDSLDRKEPLVSYWRWKNTYTTHKMQMHLAKNSDLALHTILSIVLNIW